MQTDNNNIGRLSLHSVSSPMWRQPHDIPQSWTVQCDHQRQVGRRMNTINGGEGRFDESVGIMVSHDTNMNRGQPGKLWSYSWVGNLLKGN